MSFSRTNFACGSLIDQLDGKLRVLVIGGETLWDGVNAEVYDPTTDIWQIVTIPSLPQELQECQGVMTEDGSTMYVVGSERSEVYSFQCYGGDCSAMAQHFKFGMPTNAYHTLALVPSTYASCGPTTTTTTATTTYV